MFRSKVIWIEVSTGTDGVFAAGTTETTTGFPTVVNVMSWLLSWLFPALSCTPAAMWTLKTVANGSFADGVKIRVVPCQWRDPATCGVIEKADSAVSCRTSSLNTTSIEVSVRARLPLGSGALSLI